MSGLLKLLGLGLALLLLHALLATILSPGVRPDILLVFALALGLRSGGGMGPLLLAFLMGFCVDILSGSPLGLFALLRGSACAATRLLDRALYLRAPLPWAFYVAGYAVLDPLLMNLVLRVVVPDGVLPWSLILLRLPLSALLTAILCVPLVVLTQRLDADVQGETGWTSLSSRVRT